MIPKIKSLIAPVWVGLPIWIALSEPPLHSVNKQALPLVEIGSIIGKPVKIDEPTAYQTRPSIARICVEFSLMNEKGG